MVELVFEALDDWQLKGKQSETYGVTMDIGDQSSVIWTTAPSTDMKYMQESNYVICRRMKWRFIEDNRPAEYK